MKLIRIFYFVFVVCNLSSCDKKNKLFELKNDTGILFNNKLTPTPSLNILNYLYYYNGAGVAAGDFNNDGLIDLYFTGNQVADKLYLNKGNLKFEDITKIAGIDNADGWTTGISLVDINNDSLLDIYICKVGNYKNIKGRNILYINQGNSDKNIPFFKENANHFNLDIASFSTQASFFDYDLDGDLDMFLLNHSVYPNRTYGKGKLRNEIDSLSGDKLFKNENGKYFDVSKEAGIFQGKIGYGLGISISDVNNDGYPDIYVGNDFFENDYLYINKKNGTFKDIISTNETNLGHTTHYSMGNDIGDLNNDGLTDIISLDMLPENVETYKTSGSEFSNQIYYQYLKNGFHPQYMQNTLHLNKGNQVFSEIAFTSGIAATDWSWSPLLVDLNNDGLKDIFITNGIKGATNDMDFINFIANDKIQDRINKGMHEKDLLLTNEIPEKKLANYFYKNNGDLTFSNFTDNWFEKKPTFSNGSVYADLDNDGDLELIVNNVNEKAFILENKSETLGNNFLKIKFKGSEKNKFGVGAKVIVYVDSFKIYQENFLTRGYLSSVSPDLTLGIGKQNKVDSVVVIWLDGKYQTLKNVLPNSSIVFKKDNSTGIFQSRTSDKNLLVHVKLKVDFKHHEYPSNEFNREPLIPYSKGYEGPKISIGDINEDGLDDFYIGGAKKQTGALYTQTKNGEFTLSQNDVFEKNSINEDTDNIFFDADNDGDLDLFIVSGGNEFKRGNALAPRLYFNKNGIFSLSDKIIDIEVNASVVKSFDFDNDGDQDIIIGANAHPQQFGRSAKNYILENDGYGNFKDISSSVAPEFSNIGLVEDLVIKDLNGDDLPDIIAVGHWMPISIFINSNKKFKLQNNNNLEYTNGLWNTIIAEDFDKDGDLDFIVGNWGLNTRFKASHQKPLQLYRNDFDKNGKAEPIVTYFDQGKETVFSSKDELTKQIPILSKKFTSYAQFSKADFTDLFSKDLIKNSYNKQVFELASCYFENNGNGVYTKRLLPFLAQISSAKALYLDDFDKDGFQDILTVGNDFKISTQLGRLDAFHGLILINNKKGFFELRREQNLNIQGSARDIKKLTIKGIEHLMISINNQSPVFLRKND